MKLPPIFILIILIISGCVEISVKKKPKEEEMKRLKETVDSVNASSLIIFANTGFRKGFELQMYGSKTIAKSAKELDDFLKDHRKITQITMGISKRTDSIDVEAAENVFKKYAHIQYTIFRYHSMR